MSTELGGYLKEIREAKGLTLRRVEALTEGKIKNGHLSQIEMGRVDKPRPDTLALLADLYEADCSYLWVLAGHPSVKKSRKDLESECDPAVLALLRDMSPEELSKVREFMAFLRYRRSNSQS